MSNEPSMSPSIELVGVTDTILEQLIDAAVGDADPDDVTPPLGDGWTPERIEWLRRFHRDRRRGSMARVER